MYNPVYFNYGIAIHGAANVPAHPASHGCIRINMDIAEYFPDLVSNGDLVYVWGQNGKEPEYNSAKEQKPIFNYPDPNSTTDTPTSAIVPPVVGLKASAAVAVLESVGLVAEIHYIPVAAGDPNDGLVVVAPAAGSSADSGSHVTITIAQSVPLPTLDGSEAVKSSASPGRGVSE